MDFIERIDEIMDRHEAIQQATEDRIMAIYRDKNGRLTTTYRYQYGENLKSPKTFKEIITSKVFIAGAVVFTWIIFLLII